MHGDQECGSARRCVRPLTFGIVGVLGALGIAVMSLPATLQAHMGATGVVLERMEAMKDMGDTLKGLVAMVRGEAEFDAEQVASAGETLEAHARRMPELFPEGSLSDVSEAVPEIWDNWDEFVAYAEELEIAARGFATVSDLDGLRAAVQDAGATCKACHETYRIEK